MKYKVAIIDKDTSYGVEFLNYFSFNKETKLKPIFFEDIKNYKTYIIDKGIDILLISEKLYEENIPIDNDTIVILLTDNLINTKNIELNRINKYQSIYTIEKEIISIFQSKSNKEIVEKRANNVKIIGVYSSSGGTGKTTIAIGMAKQLADKNEKVLFLCTEAIVSYTKLLTSSKKDSFSEIIYQIKGENKNLLMKTKGIVNNNQMGFDYFSEPICYEDMLEFSANDWIKYIEYLKEYSNYAFIIVDIESNISEKTKRILGICDEVYMVINNSFSAFEKNNYYNKSQEIKKEKIYKNTKIILNHNREENENYINEYINKMKIDYEIPYEKNIYDNYGSHMSISTNNKFGKGLKKIIDG